MEQILDTQYYINKNGEVYKDKIELINYDGNNIKLRIEGKIKRYNKMDLFNLVYFKNLDEDKIKLVLDNNFSNITMNNLKIVNIEYIGEKIEPDYDYYISKEGKVYVVKKGYARELKQGSTKNGYIEIRLNTYTKGKHYSIHRLVADHFIPNPENKPEVDHIDRDRTNNNYTNLRWCTRKENMEYCFEYTSPVRNFTKCVLINKDLNFEKEFNTITECCKWASENLKLSYTGLQKYKKNKGYEIKEKLND